MKTLYILLLVLFSFSSTVSGQEEKVVATEDHKSNYHNQDHSNTGYFRIALLLGHTFVALDDEGNRTTIPSWGLDLEYWFSHKVGIGLHNDLELMNYIIKRGDTEELERSFPKVITTDILYKPWRELVIFAGVGIEFEPNEDFFLYRIGWEYEIPLSEKWDICPSFFYDSRKEAYNTCSFMFGAGYSF